MAVLYGPNLTPFVHYALEIAPEKFSLESDPDETRHYTSLDIDLEIRDAEGCLMVVDVNQPLLQLSASQFQSAKSFPFGYRDNYPILPGDYKVSVVLKNRATKEYTAFWQQIHVPAVEPGTPFLGEIVLGYGKGIARTRQGGHLTYQLGAEEIYPVYRGGLSVVCEHASAGSSTRGPIRLQPSLYILGNEGTLSEEEQPAGGSADTVTKSMSLLGLVSSRESFDQTNDCSWPWKGTWQTRRHTGQPVHCGVFLESGPLINVSSMTSSFRASGPSIYGKPSLRGRRDYVESLLSASRVMLLKPLGSMGNQLMAVGRMAEAEAALERAVAADNPDFPMAQLLGELGCRLFLNYLRQIGKVADTFPERKGPAYPSLVNLFRHWMKQHRGVSESILDLYSRYICEMLQVCGEDPKRFDARGLRAFVFERARTCSRGTAKLIVTALRMFLRYLISKGKCEPGLEHALPTLAHWRLSTLPRYLSGADVERVIAACDGQTPLGARDRAIILLLARLGLRAGDVAGLRLGDVDWRDASLCVSGKGRREDRLPLSQEVGDAIFQYLKHRPPIQLRTSLCLRLRTPKALETVDGNPLSAVPCAVPVWRRLCYGAPCATPFRRDADAPSGCFAFRTSKSLYVVFGWTFDRFRDDTNVGSGSVKINAAVEAARRLRHSGGGDRGAADGVGSSLIGRLRAPATGAIESLRFVPSHPLAAG